MGSAPDGAAAAFHDHFSGHAAHYAAHRPTYPPALFDWLAGVAPGRALAWDVATGNGQAALALAQHFDRVVATDASPQQIAQAPAHPRVAWHVEPAERSRLAPQSVDLVTVAQALHWFDVPAFHAEVARVLRPGGVVAAWCYAVHSVTPAVDAVVGHLYTDLTGPCWPPERALLEDGYRTLPWPWQPVAPMPGWELVVSWRLAELVGYLETWSGVQRYRAAHGHDPVARVAAELAAAWGAPETVRQVRWPLHVRVGRHAGVPRNSSAPA